MTPPRYIPRVEVHVENIVAAAITYGGALLLLFMAGLCAGTLARRLLR